ncbi:hypothetical protein ACH4UV_40640 [Streptomyces sp. NPDC020802]|uniref:hypothetical protein n=1 Tax=Streptomyces sp. NPDC020802 TaxID=3365094 RepID=UPI0037B0B22D
MRFGTRYSNGVDISAVLKLSTFSNPVLRTGQEWIHRRLGETVIGVKIPRQYILSAILIGLVTALISVILSQAGDDSAVRTIRTAASTFAVTTTLALLIAGLWPTTSPS